MKSPCKNVFIVPLAFNTKWGIGFQVLYPSTEYKIVALSPTAKARVESYIYTLFKVLFIVKGMIVKEPTPPFLEYAILLYPTAIILFPWIDIPE